jgi:hypothetical protein
MKTDLWEKCCEEVKLARLMRLSDNSNGEVPDVITTSNLFKSLLTINCSGNKIFYSAAQQTGLC